MTKIIKINSENTCSYCNEIDTITHSLIYCKSDKHFWKGWARWWYPTTGFNIIEKNVIWISFIGVSRKEWQHYCHKLMHFICQTIYLSGKFKGQKWKHKLYCRFPGVSNPLQIRTNSWGKYMHQKQSKPLVWQIYYYISKYVMLFA